MYQSYQNTMVYSDKIIAYLILEDNGHIEQNYYENC